MPKTATKSLSIEKLATIVKPFVGSLKGKNIPRVVLKTAFITNEHIIATDAHRLIRIKHNQEVAEPYLHHFKKELTQDCSVSSYPDTDRLLPDKYNAKQEITINVAEWQEAHDLGLIAAKELVTKKYVCKKTFLEGQMIYVKDENGDFNSIAFKYILDNDTHIQEKVAYNCEYMLDGLKVLKKLGQKEAILYFYGPLRPLYFVADEVEMLILPVRTA